MSNYRELLKDPRWQKKRLEILALDYWQCRACGSKTRTLHVHHLWYEKGKNPWEYPNEALVTLCDGCHEKAKSINWRQALLDLNVCEQELLDLAGQIHFLKERWASLTADIQEKYKVRVREMYMYVSIIQDMDLYDEYCQNFRQSFMDKYTEK